jgi:hypothetical protein
LVEDQELALAQLAPINPRSRHSSRTRFRLAIAIASSGVSRLPPPLSPTLAGYLFDHVALALPFDIGAFLQGINTILFFLFFRKIVPPEEQHPATAKPSQKIAKPLQ